VVASSLTAALSIPEDEIAAVLFFDSARSGSILPAESVPVTGTGRRNVAEQNGPSGKEPTGKELTGKERILNELKQLEYEFTIELPRALRTAAALGDLSENSEYKYARERQDYVRARIRQLQQQLAKLASLDLSKLPRDRASYGSTLVLRDIDRGAEVTYRLVTPEEAEYERGLISTSSPIGRSLLNHEEGDEVTVQTPNGARRFEIIKLKTIHDED
jgi:transcription elongation factor GreA